MSSRIFRNPSTPLKIITLNWTFGSADFPFQLGKVSVNQPSNFQGLITIKMGLADWLEFQGCTGISYQLYGISWDLNLFFVAIQSFPFLIALMGMVRLPLALLRSQSLLSQTLAGPPTCRRVPQSDELRCAVRMSPGAVRTPHAHEISPFTLTKWIEL